MQFPCSLGRHCFVTWTFLHPGHYHYFKLYHKLQFCTPLNNFFEETVFGNNFFGNTDFTGFQLIHAGNCSTFPEDDYAIIKKYIFQYFPEKRWHDVSANLYQLTLINHVCFRSQQFDMLWTSLTFTLVKRFAKQQ